MFEQWIILNPDENEQGPDGGRILQDEELPSIARITVEEKTKKTTSQVYFGVTVGIYGQLVHTSYFSNQEDALEGANLAKLLIQVQKQ